jgi:hypothetical protein
MHSVPFPPELPEYGLKTQNSHGVELLYSFAEICHLLGKEEKPD